MTIIVNTRADLDALRGTPAHLEALQALAGSMATSMDMAVYPEGYGQSGYVGPSVEPDWHDVETLAIIEALGFTRESFEAEYAAATAEAEAGV